MRRYYSHRITKRERAAVDTLYAPRRFREPGRRREVYRARRGCPARAGNEIHRGGDGHRPFLRAGLCQVPDGGRVHPARRRARLYQRG